MDPLLVFVPGVAAATAGLWLVLRRVPAVRRAQQLAAQRRVARGFPRLSTWSRSRKELELRFTRRGPVYDLRLLRLHLVFALERAGAAAQVLAGLGRVDADLASMIQRLKSLGVRLDRRLALDLMLREPAALVAEVASLRVSVQEVESMASLLTSLATSAVGGTIDLEASALRRELEAEVRAVQAGLERYRDFDAATMRSELG